MERIEGLVLTFALNALWQIPAVVAVGLLGDRLLRRSPARHRHLLWLAVLAAAAILPLASLRSPRLVPVPPPWGGAAAAAAPAPELTAWLPSGRPAPVPPAAAPVVAILYGLSLAFHGLRLGIRWRRANRLARRAHPLDIPAALAPVVSQCRSALGLPGVEILGAPGIAGPVTVGARRPLILLPSRFLDSASPEELATALSHEMAHVRRRDYAVHLACEAALLPIAFHPAAWLARRRLAEAREMACDEAALETRIGSRTYARSLLSLAARAAGLPRPSTTLGVLDAHTLEARMKRILDSRPRLGTRRARAALGAALLLLAGLATTASFFPLRAVAATGHGDLAPFVGAFSGDWPADPFAAKFSGGWPVDQESRKKARALDLFIHPDGRIVRTWYKYQQAADGTATPQKVTDRVTGYTVEGNTLKIQVRVEDFAFRDRPAGVAEITETLELQGNNDGVYRMVSNSYIEDLKKRGEPVPPPPPPIPMKRGC